MSQPPILLFDFDGVVITQKALEYAALIHSRNDFYNWQNLDDLRYIDFARLFEESDSNNRIRALFQAYKTYTPYIPSRWRRIVFFVKFRRTYPKYEKYETIKPHLSELLPKLKASKFIMGIVSNTSKERLNNFRKRLDLDDFFSIFISRDDTPFRKPNPFPIFLAMKKLELKQQISIKKDNTYFIGDLPSDVITAKNAGVKSIAILSGHGREEDLKNAKPDFVLEDLSKLVDLEPIKKFLLK